VKRRDGLEGFEEFDVFLNDIFDAFDIFGSLDWEDGRRSDAGVRRGTMTEVPVGAPIDLTHPVRPGMLVPPALVKAGYGVELERVIDHERHGAEVSKYTTIIHAGTHVDAPSHFIAGGQRMEQLEVGRWAGSAYVVDLRDVGPNQAVTGALLEECGRDVRPGDLALLCTGWGERMYGQVAYWQDSPYVTADGAEWLVERRVKAAGFDFFQELAAKRDRVVPDDFVMPKNTLGNGVLLIEHLTNLSGLAGRRVYAAALPVGLVGCEGAPARAAAWVAA
jgi:kynurenine formamidase